MTKIREKNAVLCRWQRKQRYRVRTYYYASEQYTVKSSIDKAMHVRTQEQVHPDGSHWKLKTEEKFTEK
jgi:hypothetical protein